MNSRIQELESGLELTNQISGFFRCHALSF